MSPEAPERSNGRSATGYGGSGRRITPERERAITRLSLLSAAAAFYAHRPDATGVDVLETAMRCETWAAATT